MIPRILGYRHLCVISFLHLQYSPSSQFGTKRHRILAVHEPNPFLACASHGKEVRDHMNGEDITCSMILRASLFLSLLMPILLSTRSIRSALLLTFILFIYSALQHQHLAPLLLRPRYVYRLCAVHVGSVCHSDRLASDVEPVRRSGRVASDLTRPPHASDVLACVLRLAVSRMGSCRDADERGRCFSTWKKDINIRCAELTRPL
jgi:hypothetical protein